MSPNWGDNGQFINIALQINDVDSTVSAVPYGAFNFSGAAKKPSFHILHRVSDDNKVKEAAVYSASNLLTPILGTGSSMDGAEFAVDRNVGFEGKVPLEKLGLENGDTVRAIAVLSGNNKSQHGAFDVIPEAAGNEIANDWNESSSSNVLDTYGSPYEIQSFKIAIDGVKDAAWDQATLVGRSETANQFEDSPQFHIDNLRLYNDGYYLYYWIDAVNVPNWGDNGQYVNIALNINGEDSEVEGNPWNSQFNFKNAEVKPQFHIVHRIKQNDLIAGAAVYAANDFNQPILATWSSLNGALFAVDRTTDNGIRGFEGKVPLALLGLQNDDEIRAIAVLSGNTSHEQGAFDVIPETDNNELAKRWNESGTPNRLASYSSVYKVQGAVEELAIIGATPGLGAINVSNDLSEITIKFNSEVSAGSGVDKPSIAASTSVVSSTYSINADTLTFALNDKLDYSTIYSVNIPANSLNSALFGELQKDLAFTFTTMQDPLSLRYVHFYYDRPADDYEGWNIWVWATGEAETDGAIAFTEDRDGMMFAAIPVSDESHSVGFKVRKGNWESTDVDVDRYISFAPGQKTAKVVVSQGVRTIRQVEDVGRLELNNGGIPTFFYRDEALFRSNEMDTVASVKVIVEFGGNTKTFDLNYDADKEYFTGVGELSPVGKSYYQFEVTRNGATTRVNDYYNPRIDEGKSYFEYKDLTWDLGGVFESSEAHPDQNAIVNVSASAEDGQLSEIRQIYADFSAIGGSSREIIDTALMRHTAVVKDTTAPGIKQIPVSLIDIYGNSAATIVPLTIGAKPASGNGKLDFDWDEARIYFVLTDRFFNGDLTNDDPNDEGYDTEHLETYHGGDFQGLIDKLDYMERLGINTLWITPIIDNIDFNVGAGATHKNQYGYHGYWAKDFTTLDEHLGDLDTFKELIDKAHDRGIKIMVDVVVNHTGYGLKETDTNSNNVNNYPTEEDRERFAGMVRSSGGNSDITQELAGLPDFVTEDPDVRDQVVQWQVDWLNRARTDRGDTIDYFRVDTVKHVEHTTWKALKNAAAAINPDFKMIGEYFGGSPDTTGGYLGNGEMDSLLDFEFKGKAKEFVNGDIDAVESYLASRNDKLSSTATVGQFLSSHDEDGFLYSVGYDESKLKIAAALQMTSKGQPVIYYGEELGSSGPNANFRTILGENRKDMPWDKLDEKADLLTHYQKLLQARAKYSKVFAKGDHEKTAGGNEAGYLVFERSYAGENVLVGINVTDAAKTATFRVPYEGGATVVDEYGGGTYRVSCSNEVTVTIPAKANGGTIILAKTANGTGCPSGYVPPANPPGAGSVLVVKEQDLKPAADGRAVVTAGKDVTSVQLPVGASGQEGLTSVEIKTDLLSVVLPSEVLKQAAAGEKQGMIELQFVPVDSGQAGRLLASQGVSAVRFELAGGIYELTLSFVLPDGTRRKVEGFNQPVELTLKTDSDVVSNLTAIYYIGSDGALEYIGGVRSGNSITAKVNHFSKYGVLKANVSFADVATAHWASASIQSLAARGVLEGASATQFAPDRNVTRAEFAAIVARALGLRAAEGGGVRFGDVASDAWYADAVNAAAEAGIVAGRAPGRFAPQALVTREEMAVMLMRAYRYLESGAANGAVESLRASFADQGQISPWAEASVNEAVALGLLNGRGGNRFAPGAQLTRAEAAKAVYVLLAANESS